MIDGPRPRVPAEQPIGFADPDIVDARMPFGHVALLVEQPIFVAMATPPLTGSIAALVDETNSDAIAAKRPELFNEAVIELSFPLGREETFDCLAP